MNLTLRLWIYVTGYQGGSTLSLQSKKFLGLIPGRALFLCGAFMFVLVSYEFSSVSHRKHVCQVNSPVSALEHGTGIDLQLVTVRYKLLLTRGLNAEHKFTYRDQWRIANWKLKISEEKKVEYFVFCSPFTICMLKILDMHIRTDLSCSLTGENEGVFPPVMRVSLCLSLLPACLILMSSAVTSLSLSVCVLHVAVHTLSTNTKCAM